MLLEKKTSAILKALEFLITSLITISLVAIPEDSVTNSVSPRLFKEYLKGAFSLFDILSRI